MISETSLSRPARGDSPDEQEDDEQAERIEVDVPGWRLDRLSDAEREVFISVEGGGLRPAELARHTQNDPTVSGWSESTVRTLLKRARRKVGYDER